MAEHPWDYNYNSDTQTLMCNSGSIKITEVPECDIKKALDMMYFTFHSCGNRNVICSYESLIQEYEMSLIF